jgi:hypothetical protein
VSGRPPVSPQGRGEQGRDFFCDLQFHGQAPNHSLELADAVLVLAPSILALEEVFQTFEGDFLPAGGEFGLRLVLSGDLGLAFRPIRSSRTTWALN